MVKAMDLKGKREIIYGNSYLSLIQQNDKETLLSEYNDDFKEILKEADLVLEQKFSFTNPWDMEQCPKVYHFKKDIDWTISANGDDEWTYMLNRHRFLISVGKAYYLTKENKYLDFFQRLLMDWISKNPINEVTKQYSWRTIDAGVRLIHWMEALAFFVYDMTDECLERVVKSLKIHGEFLHHHNRKEMVQSNWAVIENTGLYILAIKAGFLEKSEIWREESLGFIRLCLSVQVNDDGFHWEQSGTYHNEIMLCIIRSLLAEKVCGRDLDVQLVSLLSQMSEAASLLMHPNGYQPIKGDSDQVYVKGLIDLSNRLVKGTKPITRGKVEEEWIWYFIAEGTDASDKQETEKSIMNNHHLTKKRPKFLPFSGYHVLDNESDSQSPRIVFTTGEIGGGHGHIDLLHFDYWYKGRTVIGDSGRFTYNDESAYRQYFKQASAHNTVVIDEKPFTEYVNTWVYDKVAMPMYNHRMVGTFFDYAESAHDGYFNQENPVIHTRGIMRLTNGVCLIFDKIQSHHHHQVKRFFNFCDQDIEVKKDKVKTLQKEGNINMMFLDEGESHLVDSKIANHYNQMNNGKRLIRTNKIEGNAFLTTVISPVDFHITVSKVPVYSRWGKIIPEEIGYAIKIQIKDEWWIIGNLALYSDQNSHFKAEEQWYLGRHWIKYQHKDKSVVEHYK